MDRVLIFQETVNARSSLPYDANAYVRRNTYVTDDVLSKNMHDGIVYGRALSSVLLIGKANTGAIARALSVVTHSFLVERSGLPAHNGVLR